MKVLLTRTNLDSKHLAKKLNEFGVSSVISPVIKIVSIPVEVPNKSDFQSIIITSKNTLETVKKLYFSQKVPIFCELIWKVLKIRTELLRYIKTYIKAIQKSE